MNTQSIYTKCSQEGTCSPEEALFLCQKAPLEELMASANKLRIASFSNEVEICAIINAKSGHCGMNCKFCSQSSHNSTNIESYPMMTTETLIQRIEETPTPVHRLGIVTSGGALSDADVDTLAQSIKNRKGTTPHICGSLGRLKTPALTQLKNAGLTRIHHNLETSESFYPSMCTTQTWRDRLDTVHEAQKLGLSVCCGGLFGLGETWGDRINFAFELRRENISQIPMNFLYAHEGTPLAGQAPMSPEEALRIIALFRHILPKATLRICGGRAKILKDKQDQMFHAGANAFMTGNYLTVAGNDLDDDMLMLERLNLVPRS